MDFETASELDVRRVGAHAYARHPSTRVLCLCWSVNGGPVRTWTPALGDACPEDLDWAVRGHATVEAHGFQFEEEVWERHMVPRGWPRVLPGQWSCTLARCAHRALPLRLEKAAEALRLRNRKDMAGHRRMLALSCGRSADEFSDEMVTLEYCAQDVRTEDELSAAVLELPPGEREVFLQDRVVNRRGVACDLDAVRDVLGLVEAHEERLLGELRGLTDGEVETANQRDRILAWLAERGVALPDLTADTVDHALSREGAAGGSARRVLEIRRALAKSSAKKLQKMLECACPDGRLRGLLQYHGGATGRWAGRLVQPQNFPLPTFGADPDDLVGVLRTGDPELVEAVYGDVMQAVADATRSFLVAGEGRTLASGDFRTIELRIILDLAGQTDKVDLIRRGEDPYCDMASRIFGRPITKERDYAERQIGKHSVLGLGYGMGADRFGQQYAPDRDEGFRAGVVQTYRREWAPRVPELWNAIEGAALGTAMTGEPCEAAGCEFYADGPWLACRLPSGRSIYFRDPEVHYEPVPWDPDDERPRLTAMSWEGGRWIRVSLYGGLLTGNVVQALARDLIAGAMVRAEREGMRPVLTVHDELLCEPDEGGPGHRELAEVMVADRPDWALGIPLEVEGWTGRRYRK